tara:strand:+ start:98 stop:400 length:303 start_codon:yes stop_codon:yes gene_type:complete
MEEIYNILTKIKQTKIFPEYAEFFLKKTYNLNGIDELKKLINEGNKDRTEKRVYLYNQKTHIFDIIGVIDIENVRYIDFDDNWYTMSNKGIDNQTTAFLN